MQIHQAALEGRDILRRKIGDRHAAVVLHRPHRGDDDGGRGPQTRGAAQDVDELLGTQISAEPGLRDHEVGQSQRRRCRDERVASVSDVGERTPVHERGRVLEGLHEVRRQSVPQQRRHRAVRVEVAGTHRPAVTGVGDDDVAEALLEVGQARGEAEDRHHLGCHDDVESRLARHAVADPAEPEHDVTQRAVVDVEHPPPGDPPHVDVQRVALLDVVVDQRREQVRRDRDRGEIPGEVQVDVLHRDDLRLPAAGGAALHAEHRTEGGLPQADHCAFTDPAEGVAETDRRRGLALAGGCRRHRGDQHELALRPVLERREVIQRDLRLVPAVRLDARLRDADATGDLDDRPHVRRLRDLDAARAHRRPPARRCLLRPAAALASIWPRGHADDRCRRPRAESTRWM